MTPLAAQLAAQGLDGDLALAFAEGADALPFPSLRLESEGQAAILHSLSIRAETAGDVLTRAPVLRLDAHTSVRTLPLGGIPPVAPILSGDRQAWRRAVETLAWAAAGTPAFHRLSVGPQHLVLHLLDGTEEEDHRTTPRCRLLAAARPGMRLRQDGLRYADADPFVLAARIHGLLPEGETDASRPGESAHARLAAPWRQDLVALLGRRGEAPAPQAVASERILLRRHGESLAVVARHRSLRPRGRDGKPVDPGWPSTANDHLLLLWSPDAP